MRRFLTAALLAAFSILAVPAVADEEPTLKGPLTPSEQQFVTSIQHDLMARFPHVSDAIKAGYVRYTSPDDTGAISYANQQWSADPTHPSQLWYDADGNLMGADFSVVRSNGEPRPQVWGVDPGRWYEFNGHVHYVVKDPSTGKMLYDQWILEQQLHRRRRKLDEALGRHGRQARKSAERGLYRDDLRVSDAMGLDRLGKAARPQPASLVAI